MPRNSKKVNVKMSMELVQHLQDYLNQIDLEGDEIIEVEEINEEINEEENEEENEEIVLNFEVQSVVSHKIDKSGFWFELKFKGYDGTDWVHDDDCNCEYLISKYLNKHLIQTAYLICRVSTKEQTNCTSTSLEGQESELREAVGDRYDRVKVYKISSSAYKNIPRVLENLTCVLNESTSLWVWRVDRLSRNIIKYLDWLEKLNEKKVDIHAFTEKLNYGDNKLDFIQKIVDAQKESHVIGQRVKLSYKRKRERGDDAVGNLPYGKKYKAIMNGDGTKVVRKKVVVNKDEKKIINSIKKSKKTAEEMANFLNKKGNKKRGRKWNKNMITRIRKR
jgi:DNA invertase Pin-like site-specific DNA recombinase